MTYERLHATFVAMRRMLTISLLSLLGAPVGFSQSGTQQIKSPKEVVEEFWRLETQGTRLTAEGWRKAEDFFLHPNPIPQKKTIAVISGKYKYAVDARWVKENQAEIANGCFDLGRIDDSLTYTPPDPRYVKTAVIYHLVLTDKHWELGSDGVTEKEVSGPLAWRIENAEPLFWLTVDAASRYVRERRDKTTDPMIKKNADATLARLKELR